MEHSTTPCGSPPAEGLQIIIVESNRLLATAIGQVAARCVPLATITISHTGREALLVLRKQAVQLAIVGLTLPDIDGLDVLAAIGSDCLATQRLVVMSRTDERTRGFLREIRVDGYFDPISEDPGSLDDAVRKVIDGRPFFRLDAENTRTNGSAGRHHHCA